jgi:uncharacterized protein YjeT (DUF2065 family)
MAVREVRRRTDSPGLRYASAMPVSPILMEWFVAFVLMLTGMSHMLYPRLWADLFRYLLQFRFAGLIVGSLTLPLALLVVIWHNVWALGIPVIVTIVGWIWLAKSILYLLYPAALTKAASPHMDHPRRFMIAGAILLVLGAAVVINRVVEDTLARGAA